VHQKSPSWAVVCLRGKIESVKFYQSDTNTLEEIIRFLRQFEKENLIIDAYPSCSNMMRDIL
jgi:IS1 family transposase